MNHLAPAADVGALLLAALSQLAGLVVGAVLRELGHLWAGGDPRRARLWVSELLVVAAFAAVLGYLFAITPEMSVFGPPFGAALTVYAAVSGIHAYIGAREKSVAHGWRWAAAHVVACVLVGTAGFAGALLITGVGPR